MIPHGAFPLLSTTNHRITSPPTRDYNCIAWAAGDVSAWWWPDDQDIAYWPDGVAREETIAAFVDAFRHLGFEICDDNNLEQGIEKIIIYAIKEQPTHAAKQLPNGRWSSKLGAEEDITHDLDALDGPAYGRPVKTMRRQR
jgi:hypothetical protein